MNNLQMHNHSRGTFSQQLMRDRNTMLLFNLVRKNEPISRADLARCSGLSPATVSILMENLIANEWIYESSISVPAKERGRRPILLKVNASRGFVATLEILSRGYKCKLYDICFHEVAFRRCYDIASSAENICGTLLALAAENGIGEDRLLGIHVLFPGIFNLDTGELCYSAVIPSKNLIQRNLIEYLRRRLPNTEVIINNNSAMVAYSEFINEDSVSALPLLAVTVREGLSGGIVLSDQHCMPLEVGHIIIQQEGPLCRCGNRGCLETYCSTPALFREINRQTGLCLNYQENFGTDSNRDAMLKVAQAFDAGDPAVAAVLQEFASYLCSGIISLVNVFSARSVHIGGDVYYLGKKFSEMVRKTLFQDFSIVTDTSELELEFFGDDIEQCRRAAVMMILKHIFCSN